MVACDVGRLRGGPMTILSPTTHGDLGWRPARGFGFARGVALVPVALAELPRVAQAMPVAFSKSDRRWQALAVMGPIEGANVLVSREGKWRASYVPALLRVYPFRLVEPEALALWSNYTPEHEAGEGAQPFYKDGALAPWLQQTLTFLKTVQSGIGALHTPLAGLEAAGALVPWAGPKLEVPQPERALRGLFALDSERLSACDESHALNLFQAGHLRWLYAHLDSLHHTERFKALARDLVAPPGQAAGKPDKLDQVADILATLAEEMGG